MQDQTNAMAHLREHMTYPANKAQLVAACNNLSDFSEEDKKSFAAKLPEGTYNSAEEVAAAIGLKPAA
ncbi:hypothetical protein HYU96_04830 [Candidatus Daviesbacteria bacterium]|nr:hypothetical protein [Candidatus Daviesbacteria bacterium]